MELVLPSDATGGRMTGKPCERAVKWQLCYDTSARTWWMVSGPPAVIGGRCVLAPGDPVLGLIRCRPTPSPPVRTCLGGAVAVLDVRRSGTERFNSREFSVCTL
ncbi:unnamed protein product [Lota lota]